MNSIPQSAPQCSISLPAEPVSAAAAAALKLAAAGLSPMPLIYGDKRPFARLSHHMFCNSPAPHMALDRIPIVFAGRKNVGVAIRRGQFVIDYDHAGDGAAALAVLRKAGVQVYGWTTSRGLHLVFRHTNPNAEVATVKGPGVDLKGFRTYVVAAGSVHATGVLYTWLDGCAAEPPVIAPEDLAALLPNLPPVTAQQGTRRRMLKWQEAISRSYAPGERNDAMAPAVLSALRTNNAGALQQVVDHFSALGLGQDEIDKCIAQAEKKAGRTAGELQDVQAVDPEALAAFKFGAGRADSAASRRAVWTAITRRAAIEGSHAVRLGLAEVAAAAGVGKPAAHKAMAWFRSQGWLSVVQPANNHRRLATVYRVDWTLVKAEVEKGWTKRTPICHLTRSVGVRFVHFSPTPHRILSVLSTLPNGATYTELATLTGYNYRTIRRHFAAGSPLQVAGVVEPLPKQGNSHVWTIASIGYDAAAEALSRVSLLPPTPEAARAKHAAHAARALADLAEWWTGPGAEAAHDAPQATGVLERMNTPGPVQRAAQPATAPKRGTSAARGEPGPVKAARGGAGWRAAEPEARRSSHHDELVALARDTAMR